MIDCVRPAEVCQGLPISREIFPHPVIPMGWLHSECDFYRPLILSLHTFLRIHASMGVLVSMMKLHRCVCVGHRSLTSLS